MVAAEDPESFFATAPPLGDAGAVAARLQEFLARNSPHPSSGNRALPLGKAPRPARERTRDVRGSFRRTPEARRRAVADPCEPVSQCARRGRRAAADRVRHVGRDDGAAGAAVRALHRQLQLRPPWRRVHRVSFLASFQLLVVLLCAMMASGSPIVHSVPNHTDAPVNRDHKFSSPRKIVKCATMI